MRYILLALASLFATDALAKCDPGPFLQGALPADGATEVPRNADVVVRYRGGRRNGWDHWTFGDKAELVGSLVLLGPEGEAVPGRWDSRFELDGMLLHFLPDDLLQPGEHEVGSVASGEVLSTFHVTDVLDDTPPAVPTFADPRWWSGEGSCPGEPVFGLRLGDILSDEPVRLQVLLAGDDDLTYGIERSYVGTSAAWLHGDCWTDAEVGSLHPGGTWISVRAVDVAGNVSEERVLGPGDLRLDGERPFAGCSQAPLGLGWTALGLLPLVGLRRRR